MAGTPALALAVMQFDSVRHLGTSVLASAGVVGVVVGLAAQRTLGNLWAGIQIAFSQPLRINDGVSVDGEFGKVEEITLTYVVVGLWDGRRLIVPLSRVIEAPFHNWTRSATAVLGGISVRVDHRIRLEPFKQAALALVEAQPLWDRRSVAFQVLDWGERTVELRLVVSAADAGAAFDLRCALREQLLIWLQQHQPEALPSVHFRPEGKP